MKHSLRALTEHVLRRIPLARAAYHQRDALQARVAALEAAYAAPLPVVPEPARDPHLLEELTPVQLTTDERIALAMRCRDADTLPKVRDAGEVQHGPDGMDVQVMFNGIRVKAGGYYDAWMQTLIGHCRGHHEPQEEVLFAEVLRHLPPDATMIELGAFWSFYSIWFLREGIGRRAIAVEADPVHLEVGRTNAALNGVAPVFVHAFAGGEAAPPTPFQTEKSGMLALPCVSVETLMAEHGIARLDLLHCDAQGCEFAVIESCIEGGAAGRIGWLIVSTHAHHISGDPLTHQRCLAALRRAGATVLAEHDVQESFSGDGLIVATFGPVPEGWTAPRLSYNRTSESLFRNPLYDLAQVQAEARAAASVQARASAPWTRLGQSRRLAAAGAVIALTDHCPLGAPGTRIMLPFDEVMFPDVAAHDGWALDTLAFLEKHVDREVPYTLLDIGANVGLFTRQTALRFPRIARLICVEADPGNYRALRFNLEGLPQAQIDAWNVALSDADGEARFFRDRENIGNYSLNDDAMRDRPYETVVVRAAETGFWLGAHVPVPDGTRIIWKSDTQGYDELIVSRTPWEIWNKVEVAVIELWRIRKPEFDRDAFTARIASFPNISVGGETAGTVEDVLAYLDADDWRHTDLYLWR